MENVQLYYGYVESDEGIFHAFSAEDPINPPDSGNIADELAGLLDTVPEDTRFGWDCMDIRIPDSVVERIRKAGVELAVNAMKPVQPRKVYTVDSFKKTLYDRVIEATGRVSSSSKAEDCINYSSILTKLIQVAGRLVDAYASDLFITWNAVVRDLDFSCEKVFYQKGDAEVYQSAKLFGFREMGVDSTESILGHFNNDGPSYYGRDYREIWRLDYSVARTGEVKMALYKVEKAV